MQVAFDVLQSQESLSSILVLSQIMCSYRCIHCCVDTVTVVSCFRYATGRTQIQEADHWKELFVVYYSFAHKPAIRWQQATWQQETISGRGESCHDDDEQKSICIKTQARSAAEKDHHNRRQLEL